jgi:ATP/maltotriose-dependent transcriptional regulator MalT
MLAWALRAQGDLESTHETLQEAERLARNHHLAPGARDTLESALVDLWLAQGNLAAASRLARNTQCGGRATPLVSAQHSSVERKMEVGDKVVLQALARLRRQASVAQVGGFRPPEDPRSS